jgi:hypothetical protein
VRLAAALLLVAAAGTAGCGSSGAFRPAAPTTRTLDWRGSGRLVYTVRTLTVRGHGWSVAAGLTNSTGATLAIARIHRPYPQTSFGIAEVVGDERARPPQRYATQFTPPLPRRLPPGASWRGVFSGPSALPAGRRFRVVFGTFFATPPVVLGGRRFSRFDLYSDQSVLLE